MQIQISWLFRSQLIWIYIVCKGRVYPGSAGQRLRSFLIVQFNALHVRWKENSADDILKYFSEGKIRKLSSIYCLLNLPRIVKVKASEGIWIQTEKLKWYIYLCKTASTFWTATLTLQTKGASWLPQVSSFWWEEYPTTNREGMKINIRTMWHKLTEKCMLEKTSVKHEFTFIMYGKNPIAFTSTESSVCSSLHSDQGLYCPILVQVSSGSPISPA